MRTRTRTKYVKTVIAALILICQIGCMTVRDGSAHPFTTMFRDYQPQPQHVFHTTLLNGDGEPDFEEVSIR